MKILCVIESNFLKTITKQYCLSSQIDYVFSEVNREEVINYLPKEKPDIILLQEKYSDADTFDLIRGIRTSGFSNEIIVFTTDDIKKITEERLSEYKSLKKIIIVGKNHFPGCLKEILGRNVKIVHSTHKLKPKTSILVVDDSKIIHKVIRDALPSSRYTILSAFNGLEGLDLYKEKLPDIILTDIEMPVMNGLEFCKIIKENNTGRYIPVIVISSLNRPLDMDTAFNYGADDYIVKPISKDELLLKLDEFVLSIERKKHSKIIAIDDDKLVREIIRHACLTHGLNILTAENGTQGYEMILEHKPEVVITDVEMPGMNGYEICEKVRKNPELENTLLLMMSAKDQPCDIKRAERLGVRRYFVKPFDVEKMIIVVEQLLEESYRFYKYDFDNMINSMTSLIKALETRDKYTQGHSSRVAEMSIAIAHSMALPEKEVNKIRIAANLHDIGKIGVRDNILLKEGKLSDDEFSNIKEHAVIGAEILKPIRMLRDIIPLILFHHERWDGLGYPSMIHGDEIPLGARIISVADTFDAMTTDRPYRKAVSDDTAVKTIEENIGAQFCPESARAFVKMMRT